MCPISLAVRFELVAISTVAPAEQPITGSASVPLLAMFLVRMAIEGFLCTVAAGTDCAMVSRRWHWLRASAWQISGILIFRKLANDTPMRDVVRSRKVKPLIFREVVQCMSAWNTKVHRNEREVGPRCIHLGEAANDCLRQ